MMVGDWLCCDCEGLGYIDILDKCVLILRWMNEIWISK